MLRAAPHVLANGRRRETPAPASVRAYEETIIDEAYLREREEINYDDTREEDTYDAPPFQPIFIDMQ